MKKAVAYCRFSSDLQREESIDAQVRAIKEYCDKKEIQLLKVYADEGISGTTDERPQFQKMISDSEMKLFDFVIVHKLDRFSRSKYDSTIYKRRLKINGVSVLSVLENLDDSPESLILESVLEGMSEYYSRNLSREVKKGLNENALKCKHNGGTPPLGYDVNANKEYVINNYEAEAVKIIFNLYAKGAGYNHIIKILNDRGYKTKKGNNFGKNSIHEILINQKYIGNYTYNKIGGSLYKKTRNNHAMPSEKMIVIENGIPAIIDKKLFEEVQKIKINNRRKSGRFKATREYILTGLVYCGVCGELMSGQTNTNKVKQSKYHYYRCSNLNCKAKMVRAEKLENYVIECFEEIIFTKSNRMVIAQSMLDTLEKKNNNHNEINNLKSSLFEVEKSTNNLIDVLMSGVNSDAIQEKLKELEDKKREILNLIELKSLESQSKYSLEDLLHYLEHDNFKEYDALDQKYILSKFIKKIIVSENNFKIALNTVKLPFYNKRRVFDGGDGSLHSIYTKNNFIIIQKI